MINQFSKQIELNSSVDNFCLISGMEIEGIYRLSGQHSKVTQLVKLMMEGIFADRLFTLDITIIVTFFIL